MTRRGLAVSVSFVAAWGFLTTNAFAQTNAGTDDFSPEVYCTSVDRGAPKDMPATVVAIMEDEANQYDGFQIAEAVMISAAIDVAHGSESEQDCLTTFSDGADKFGLQLADNRRALAKKGGGDMSKDADIKQVQQQLTRLWREDQSARSTYLVSQTDDKTGADFWTARLAVAHATRTDEESKRYVESLLDKYDWIDRKRFGGAVSDHAWILVQHADDYPQFQARVLARMEPYLKTKGVSKKNYAYLWDRVAVNTGQKQRYGTQPDWKCKDGQMALMPLEDPENVNRRRRKMGLNKVEKGMARMNAQVCGAS